MSSATASRQAGFQGVIESHQADRVLLMNHQITNGGREADCVIEFCQILSIRVSHTAGQIHQQVTRDVSFGLVSLDIDAVGASKHLPVDIFRVIARLVSSVLTEFNAEPLKRAGV